MIEKLKWGLWIKKFLIITIPLLCFSANIDYQKSNNIHIWTQKEKPSIENNFQRDIDIYQTNDIKEAIGVTLIESLFHIDEIGKSKELNLDFEYLDELQNSIKIKKDSNITKKQKYYK